MNGPLKRSVFIEAQVSSVIVVILKVGFEYSLQVAFIQYDHMVEAISSN